MLMINAIECNNFEQLFAFDCLHFLQIYCTILFYRFNLAIHLFFN